MTTHTPLRPLKCKNLGRRMARALWLPDQKPDTVTLLHFAFHTRSRSAYSANLCSVLFVVMFLVLCSPRAVEEPAAVPEAALGGLCCVSARLPGLVLLPELPHGALVLHGQRDGLYRGRDRFHVMFST